MNTENKQAANLAFRFVLTVGIVNLFADLTYEGARSVVGPFLGSLGASAAVVGFVAGLGELAGYGLRAVSGYFADKSHKYWQTVFIGYAINMLAVPALALAGNWPMAAVLLVAERTGRAIRKPAMESMLAEAGETMGHGWVFGLNEALDQTGATIGPLIVAYVLYRHGNYRHGFAVLLASALACLAVLIVAFMLQPGRKKTGAATFSANASKRFSGSYWTYAAAGALIAAGFADFSLIAYHFQRAGTVHQAAIPVYYATAMATGAIASLIMGKLLDNFGLPIVLIGFAIAAFFAPLVFLKSAPWELAGMILWGIGIGAQDSCLKALLASVIPAGRRGTAFGVFDTVFGIAWFAGSAIMGLLYAKSIMALVLFSVVLQLLALPVFLFGASPRRRNRADRSAQA